MNTTEEFPTTTPFKLSTPDGDADVWIITGANEDWLLEQARNGDDEALCALCTSVDEGREYFMKDKSDRCSGCGTEFTPDNEPAIIIVVHFLDALDANGGDLVKLNALCDKCADGNGQDLVRRELVKMGVLPERILQ